MRYSVFFLICVFALSFDLQAQSIQYSSLKISKIRTEGGGINRISDSVFCEPYRSNNRTVRMHVLSFTIVIEHKGKVIFKETVKGNRFSDSAKKEIDRLIPYDKIKLSSVIIADDMGQSYTVRQKEFVIGL